MYLNLDFLEIRRTRFDLVMVYKLFNGLVSMDKSSIINIKKITTIPEAILCNLVRIHVN